MESFLIYLLKASAVLGLFLAAYQLFLKRDTHFGLNRWFLLAGPLAALALPLVSITRQVPLDISATETFPILYTASETGVSSALTPTAGMDWLALLLWIYVAGLCLFLLRLLRDLWQIQRLARTGAITRRDGFTYVATRRIHSPFSFFRHIFYHPDQHEPGELSLILEHERAHGSQLHSLDILLGRLTGALLWINPICGLYRKCMEQNLEYLADAQTVQRVASLRDYQYTMLKVSGNPVAPGLVNAFYHSLIKKRIVMLHQDPSKAVHRLKPLLVLPLLAAFLMAFNTRTEYVPLDGPANYLEPDPAPGTAEWLSSDKTIELMIDRNTTDDELVKMKEKLAEDGIDFSYTAVRNDDREIINFSFDFKGKAKNGKPYSGSFDTDSDEPIEPLLIRIDDQGSIAFGKAEFVHTRSGKGNNVWIHKSDDDHDEIIEIIHDEDHEVDEDVDVRVHRIRMSDDDEDRIIEIAPHSGDRTSRRIEIRVDDDGNHTSIFSGDGDHMPDFSEGDPLIFIDGKKSTARKASKLNKEDVERIEVLKGNKMIEKYGEDARNGVVEITTKKN